MSYLRSRSVARLPENADYAALKPSEKQEPEASSSSFMSLLPANPDVAVCRILLYFPFFP